MRFNYWLILYLCILVFQRSVYCNGCQLALPCSSEIHSRSTLLDFHLWCDWDYRIW